MVVSQPTQNVNFKNSSSAIVKSIDEVKKRYESHLILNTSINMTFYNDNVDDCFGESLDDCDNHTNSFFYKPEEDKDYNDITDDIIDADIEPVLSKRDLMKHKRSTRLEMQHKAYEKEVERQKRLEKSILENLEKKNELGLPIYTDFLSDPKPPKKKKTKDQKEEEKKRRSARKFGGQSRNKSSSGGVFASPVLSTQHYTKVAEKVNLYNPSEKEAEPIKYDHFKIVDGICQFDYPKYQISYKARKRQTYDHRHFNTKIDGTKIDMSYLSRDDYKQFCDDISVLKPLKISDVVSCKTEVIPRISSEHSITAINNLAEQEAKTSLEATYVAPSNESLEDFIEFIQFESTEVKPSTCQEQEQSTQVGDDSLKVKTLSTMNKLNENSQQTIVESTSVSQDSNIDVIIANATVEELLQIVAKSNKRLAQLLTTEQKNLIFPKERQIQTLKVVKPKLPTRKVDSVHEIPEGMHIVYQAVHSDVVEKKFDTRSSESLYEQPITAITVEAPEIFTQEITEVIQKKDDVSPPLPQRVPYKAPRVVRPQPSLGLPEKKPTGTIPKVVKPKTTFVDDGVPKNLVREKRLKALMVHNDKKLANPDKIVNAGVRPVNTKPVSRENSFAKETKDNLAPSTAPVVFVPPTEIKEFKPTVTKPKTTPLVCPYKGLHPKKYKESLDLCKRSKGIENPEDTAARSLYKKLLHMYFASLAKRWQLHNRLNKSKHFNPWLRSVNEVWNLLKQNKTEDLFQVIDNWRKGAIAFTKPPSFPANWFSAESEVSSD